MNDPKIWAKRKIEHLQQLYYLAGENSPEADTLEAQAIALSICYGVISDFTSFTGPPLTFMQETGPEKESAWTWEAFPNPISEEVSLKVYLPFDWYEPVTLHILDAQGRLVRTLSATFGPAGWHEVRWDGQLENGLPAPKGVYFVVLQVENDWNVLTLVKN